MSKRTKFLLGIGVIAALVIGFQVAAFAVHDEVFQLEGNAVDDAGSAQPDDWENVFEGTDSADETAFVQEPDPNDSFFTGGGSKDPDNIPAWKWKDETGGLPDKSNLTNSYAASYTVGTGASARELLYFGADRFDGSGDAAIAFWFLQDEVAQTPASGSNGTFTGQHQEDDVLVISNFSNGGVVSTITVYEWDAPGIDDDNLPDPDDPGCTKAANNNPQAGQCGAANLRVVTTSNTADCATVTAANDDACAIVNNAQDNNTAPWPFDNKDNGTANNAEFLPGEFFEGGIDLTALGLGGQCFATAVAETRTSTSPTSVLKDFTIGEFGDCEAGVTTQASKADGSDQGTDPDVAGTVTPGTTVFDIATITGSGTSPLIDPTGTVDFFLCGPGQLNDVDANGCSAKDNDPDTAVGTDKPVSGGTNTTDGISTATSDNVNTAGSPLAPGTYCFRAEYSGDGNYDPDSETNAVSECFTVADTFSIGTQQSYIPQDKATITMTGGSAVAGTVQFRLYASQTQCNTNGGTEATGLLYEESVTVTNGTSPHSASTNNDGVPAAGTGGDGDAGYSVTATDPDLYWRVTFTPTDTSITGTNSVCVEDSSVTISNN